MLAELPELPAGRPGILGEHQLGLVFHDFGRRIKDHICVSVACQPNIKAGSGQGFHLAAEDLFVGRRLRQDVVGMDKRAPL